MNGICTLANDCVYDQLVALLNSIEVVAGSKMPVCVYPYDNYTEKIAAEIAKRPNVQLYDDQESIQSWDNFAHTVWDSHPTARQRWNQVGKMGYYRFGVHRRFCAFDGPFQRFLYMDSDTLLFSRVDEIFDLLDQHDCVVYDFQYKDPTHVYEVQSPKLTELFPADRVMTEIFCSGFYASKQGLFDSQKRAWLISQLTTGEAEILYPMAPDQTLLNYMMMRSGASIYNLALKLPAEQKTGCCVTSPHFQEQDYVLYDKGQRLTYLHYIGISFQVFKRICAGENLEFSYRNLFLHYRYLHEPEKRPQFKGRPKPYNAPLSLVNKVMKKLGL